MKNRGFGLAGLLIAVLILALLSVILVKTLNSLTTTKTGVPSGSERAVADQVQDVVDQANQRAAASGG